MKFKVGDKAIFINKHREEDRVNGTIVTITKIVDSVNRDTEYEGKNDAGHDFIIYYGEAHPLTKLHKALL